MKKSSADLPCSRNVFVEESFTLPNGTFTAFDGGAHHRLVLLKLLPASGQRFILYEVKVFTGVLSGRVGGGLSRPPHLELAELAHGVGPVAHCRDDVGAVDNSAVDGHDRFS